MTGWRPEQAPHCQKDERTQRQTVLFCKKAFVAFHPSSPNEKRRGLDRAEIGRSKLTQAFES